MGKIVGIDLGTTNSLVAVMDLGIPIVIADNEGSRLTPSVVHFPESGEPAIGHAANRVRVLKSSETVYSVKRFMGRRGSEMTQDDLFVTYPVEGHGNGPVKINIHGRAYSPEEVSSFILKKLKADAESYLGEKVDQAVITVPAYFNDAQRNATIKAGELAGFKVERIVNEPTAAALAYGLDKLKDKTKIAVYDLGGGTFDISILEMNEGTFQVLSTNGNTRLGGDDIDKVIIDLLINRLVADAQSQEITEPSVKKNGELMSRLREESEKAKIRLSTEESVEIIIPFVTSTFSFSFKLTRETLDSIGKPIVDKTRQHCIRAISDAKIKLEDLTQIILVGGQTRMPLVRTFVADFFQKSPNVSINPDEAVAVGAAIQAGILSGAVSNILLLDITPLSLGIETFGGLMNAIIPRNTTIPVKAGELFTNAVSNQKLMKIHVLQGERELAKDNWSLGNFDLEFEPGPAGAARVGVQFEIDANGILHVLARDVKSGKQKIVEMKSAVDVDDTEVQKMIEESLENALDDMTERQWIEAKIKAGEMLRATRHALAELHHQISAEMKLQIETLMSGVESALEKKSIPDLKKANAALDEGTVELANVLMDHAMEEALKKKGIL
ncbi:MAG: molecular chaperone DnaK [Verrucomicrobiota bacterium]|nr:molecular chaperone DnaK [Verrucomicrobiota bacterium]